LPKQPPRTKPVTIAQAKQYLGKAEEFLASAKDDLDQSRMIAATSSALHAAINASDVVTGVRSGQRSSGEGHGQTMELLKVSGADGAAVAKIITRLLALKPKAEYDPSDIAPRTARQAVEWAGRCVEIARRGDARFCPCGQRGHSGLSTPASRYHGIMTRQTTVRLPEELADEAEVVARVKGTSVNALIIESLSAEIERVRTDKEFTTRANRLLKRDKELLDRLAR
jgi:hypothetical protein